MVEEEREELGGVQESRAELCVCVWVGGGGGVVQREQAILSGEKNV